LKLEIAKKKLTTVLINATIIVLIVFFIPQIIINEDEALRIGGGLFIVIIIFFAFRILPALPFKRFDTIGFININSLKMIIEKDGINKEFDIRDLNSVEIKLVGYHGQPRVGDEAGYIYNNSTNNKMGLMDGLGNYISFMHKSEKYCHNIYCPNKKEYEELKNVLVKWKETCPEIKINLIR